MYLGGPRAFRTPVRSAHLALGTLPSVAVVAIIGNRGTATEISHRDLKVLIKLKRPRIVRPLDREHPRLLRVNLGDNVNPARDLEMDGATGYLHPPVRIRANQSNRATRATLAIPGVSEPTFNVGSWSLRRINGVRLPRHGDISFASGGVCFEPNRGLSEQHRLSAGARRNAQRALQ